MQLIPCIAIVTNQHDHTNQHAAWLTSKSDNDIQLLAIAYASHLADTKVIRCHHMFSVSNALTNMRSRWTS